MRNIGDTAVTIICGLALLAVMTVAQAQGLADPTRPPAALANPDPATAGQAEAASVGLQTIIRRSGAKPAAIINGEYVVLGGRVGDARLVKIGDDSVTLKSSVGTETLKLIPGVEKTASKTDRKAAAESAGKGASK